MSKIPVLKIPLTNYEVMPRYIVLFSLTAMLFSCNQTKMPPVTNYTDSGNTISAIKVPGKNNLGWVDTLMQEYIHDKKLDTLRTEGNNKIRETWILNDPEYTDTATYLIIEVGHSFEHNYVPDKWVYIDSVKRNLYEYDFSADSLIKWK